MFNTVQGEMSESGCEGCQKNPWTEKDDIVLKCIQRIFEPLRELVRFEQDKIYAEMEALGPKFADLLIWKKRIDLANMVLDGNLTEMTSAENVLIYKVLMGERPVPKKLGAQINIIGRDVIMTFEYLWRIYRFVSKIWDEMVAQVDHQVYDITLFLGILPFCSHKLFS